MTDVGKVVITAPGVDVKLVNRLLLHLRDWEYGSDPTWDQFRIFHRVSDLMKDKDGNVATASGDITAPPVQEFIGGDSNHEHNEFEGMTLPAVEALMFESGHSLFLVLDAEGVSTGTVVLVQRALDLAEVTGNLYLDEFNKMRVSWADVTIVHTNLAISNLGFEDYVSPEEAGGFADVDAARSRGRWWPFHRIGDALPEEMVNRRDTAVRELEKLDLA